MSRSRVGFLPGFSLVFAALSAAIVPAACARGEALGELSGAGGNGGAGGSGSDRTVVTNSTTTGFPSSTSTAPDNSTSTTTGGFPAANSTSTTTGGFPTATNTSSPSSTGSGSSSCDDSGDCSTCATCSQTSYCASQYDTCNNDPTLDCLFFQFCIQPCASTDQACFDDCASQYPDGAQEFNDYAVCVVCTACYDDCMGATAGCP
jgi:hypothetical protein